MPLAEFFLNKTEGVIGFFVFMCKSCVLGAVLSKRNTNLHSMIEMNNLDTEPKWKKVLIPFKVSSLQNERFTLSVYTEFNSKNESEEPFWVIQGLKTVENGKNMLNEFYVLYLK